MESESEGEGKLVRKEGEEDMALREAHEGKSLRGMLVLCVDGVKQVEDEILKILDLTENVLSKFGFTNYEINLSTRPEKSIGSDDIWDLATSALTKALERKGWSYSVDEGGGAFYGPKIDLKIRDALGRKWQCSTIQCDFNLPQRFDLEYVAPDGTSQRVRQISATHLSPPHPFTPALCSLNSLPLRSSSADPPPYLSLQPIMIHRAIFGSVERFFGILVENYAGEFPLWFAPEQLRLLPINDEVVPFCEK
eukprot:750125-Hanusia_phi.AAC.3